MTLNDWQCLFPNLHLNYQILSFLYPKYSSPSPPWGLSCKAPLSLPRTDKTALYPVSQHHSCPTYVHSLYHLKNYRRNANMIMALLNLKLFTRSQLLLEKERRKCLIWLPSTSCLSPCKLLHLHHTSVFPSSLSHWPSFISSNVLNISSFRTLYLLSPLPEMFSFQSNITSFS